MLEAVAAAGRAAPVAGVEAERAGRVSARSRFLRLREEGADGVEGPHVARGVGARRPADGRLVDEHDVGDARRPVHLAEPARRFRRLAEVLEECGCRTSWIRVDLPEPDTPVTHTKRCSGNSTSTSFRLCSVTPRIASLGVSAAGGREATPASARRRPDRYCAVTVPACLSSSGVPKNTISPPRSPGPGPMSSRRSASSMICGSCSTTTSEFPASRSLFITPMTRPMSRGCRPMEGSSSTNRVFTSDVPSAVVRLMRCTSPPESVRDWRSRVR